MSNILIKSGLLPLLAIAALCVSALARAGGSLLPDVPEAQRRVSEAQGCVEPTAEMRRNHMKYILHQRDETMHQGIRTRQHSLEECINCHVSSAPDAARVSSEQHFCNSCHTYAAVNIDCFECHSDRPAVKAQKQSMTPASSSASTQADENPAAMPTGDHRQLAAEDINHD